MLNKNNLAVIAYTNFSSDSRVQKEAMAAAECGYELDIYSLHDKDSNNFKTFNFIKCNNNQYRGHSKYKYVFSYLRFFLYCLTNLSINYFRKKYRVVHFHNMPNFLVFSALIPKLFGAKIILDIHDLMPELFSAKFNLQTSHLLIKALYFEERISAKFAHEIIATNNFHVERFKKNKITNKRITEIINVADEKIFYAPQVDKYSNSEELVIAYPSTLSKRLGIDNLIDAVEILYNKGIEIKLNIYGDGEYRSDILEIVKSKKLENIISLSNSFVTLENLSSELDKAHIGVIPLPSNKSNDIAMPVKIYEFFAKQICVVASNLPLLSSCFSNSILLFEPSNSKDLAQKIEYLNNNRDEMKKLADAGFKKFSSKTWNHYKEKYIELIVKEKI